MGKNGPQKYLHQCKIGFVLFVRMNQALCVHLTNYTNAEYLFLIFFWQVFRQAGPPQRVDCLAAMENKCEVSLPKTQ